MTKKQVWRYNCDFCGKKKYSAGAMTTHENHCTLNPNRECRLHAHGDLESQVPMAELLEAAKLCPKTKEKWFIGMDDGKERWDEIEVLEDCKPLREAAKDCPICVLSALRQSGLHFQGAFYYHEEMKSFWATANDTGE